jgi:DNA repair protein RadA
MTKNGDEINITDFSQIKGVGPETAKKLRNKGDYFTITEIATAIPEELSKNTDINPTLSKEIVQEANRFLQQKGFIGSKIRSALDDLDRRSSLFKINTGSTALNGLLGGGIEEGSITEIFAVNGGGKTQICHTVAMNATLPVEKGGIDGNVLYIDTEGAFRPNRIRQMCLALGHNPTDVLGRITVASMQYKAEFLLTIDELPKIVEEKKIKLIVVDSIIALFRGEYGGMGELASRQQSLGSVIHKLSRIIDVFHPAILITNQMQDYVSQFGGGGKIPCGGNTLGHASTYRIKLGTESKTHYRTAMIYKSPESDNDTVTFHVTEKGVVDVPPKKGGKKKEEEEVSESEE